MVRCVLLQFWQNGAAVSSRYANWFAGQPDSWLIEEDCVALLSSHYQWFDMACYNPFPFFVEYEGLACECVFFLEIFRRSISYRCLVIVVSPSILCDEPPVVANTTVQCVAGPSGANNSYLTTCRFTGAILF